VREDESGREINAFMQTLACDFVVLVLRIYNLVLDCTSDNINGFAIFLDIFVAVAKVPLLLSSSPPPSLS
jgi:hypothetical protein